MADLPFSAPDFRYDLAWETDPELWSAGDVVENVDERDALWLRFCCARLEAMRDVLADTGVLAFTADHRNLFRAGSLVDLIFGVENRLTVLGFERRFVLDGRQSSDWLYVIVAAREFGAWQAGPGAEAGFPQWWSAEELGDVWPPATRQYNTVGMHEVEELIGRHRSYAAKPVSVYRRMVELWCPPGGVVLDPFAGSGTSGHATSLVGGGRSFLMVDEESVVESVLAPRLKAAGVAYERWKVADGYASASTG